MEHGFPPGSASSGMTAGAIVFHLAMLMLAVGSVGGLFLTRKRIATGSDIWMWGLVIFAAPIAVFMVVPTLGRFAREAAAPFVLWYILFVWAVSFTGMVRSHRFIRRQQKSSPLWYSIISLAILGVLITMSLPAVPHAREAARRAQCQNNVKQLATALHNYRVKHETFPLAVTGSPVVSWRVQLLPFYDRQTLYEQYDLDAAWSSEQNEPLSRIVVSSLRCPSRRLPVGGVDEQGRCFTDYAMLTGDNSFSDNIKPRTLEGITDGESNTLALVEATGLNIIWTEPRDAKVGRDPLGINLKGTGTHDSPGLMSSWHPGVAHAAFVDGSARHINQNIDSAVLKALTTVNGGEIIPEHY